MRQQAHIPHHHVGHDPDQQPGRRRDRDRPPQYEQGAVKNRTDDHLADLGTPVGRQFEGEKEGTPFRMVFERRRETSRVIRIPSRITAVSSTAESREVPNPALAPMKNMVMMAMRVGNRPLQGTKLLVMVAIRRSLGNR